MWKARLDSAEGAMVSEVEFPAGSPPQAIVVVKDDLDSGRGNGTIDYQAVLESRVFIRHSEEPGWPHAPNSRVIYREVSTLVLG